jgi:DNA mismatch repair protein MutS2
VSTTFIPDLLHLQPMAGLDLEAAQEVLGFAFQAGGSEVASASNVRLSRIALSTWSPDCFARDIFLSELVQSLNRIQLDGQEYELQAEELERLLAHPPAEPKNTFFRQAVLAELVANPECRRSFEQAYLKARRFRALVSDSETNQRVGANRRRVEILEAARVLIEGLASSFEGASSGLSRLREFGQLVRDSEGFAQLASVLELEQGMAAIEARIRIDYEGELRHFEIVRVSEQTQNPFYATRLGRLFRKFVMFLRGYGFSDAEVLGQFVDEIFAGVEQELVKVFQLIRDMEFYLAALSFRDRCLEHGLTVCLPEFAFPGAGQGVPRRLMQLFNPLLVAPGRTPVPCDLTQQKHDDVVVLTGPNSGGKTRLLQSLSLSQLLGQGGFFIPAASAKLVRANAMFLSIAAHATADHKEGRLGTELLRVRKVFESSRFGAFVVVDELCSGTNPGEGEEIFRMVLELLRELEPQAFVSTHFLQFAARLKAESQQGGLAFLKVELDANSRPTYGFVDGVATTSLAHQTAARLGVTREELLALIDEHKRTRGPSRHAASPSVRPAALV